MADFTPNYNLKKPLRTEYYNVADANGNSDIIDSQLKEVNDRVGVVEGDVVALEDGKVDKEVGKGLSDENYTLLEKNKVANVPDDTIAQLNDMTQDFSAQLADIEQDKAEKMEIGLLSGLLTTAKTSLVNAINELFNNKANKTQEAWITPTLLNGWEHRIATNKLQYRKNQFGKVEWRGAIKNGVAGTKVCDIPAGYYKQTFIVTGGLNYAGGMAEISITGVGFAVEKSSSTTWISCENISYYVD